MPTIDADIFRISPSGGQEVDEVARNHASRGMPDHAIRRSVLREGGQLQEGVAAEAGIFLVTIPGRHVPGAMAKQPAQVADLLPEGGGRGVGIVLLLKEQRVAALRADVFVAPVAVGELLLVMLAEKAR